jgi:Domain of unknown function (DUF6950)
MTERVRNWSQLLMHWANSLNGAAFAWGETDCCTLVREALMRLYGEDITPQVPRWASKTEALAVGADFTLTAVLGVLGATVTTLSYRDGGDVLVGPVLPETDPWPYVSLSLPTGDLLNSHPESGVRILPFREVPETTVVYQVPWTVEVG